MRERADEPVVQIPVCYGGSLAWICLCRGTSRLSAEEVIQLHNATRYLVHFLGFSPGFGYLGVCQNSWNARGWSRGQTVAAGSVG